jgi:hypothetical protein
MKILNVLINESAALAYRDISDMQTTVLMRVASGKSSYETASPREQGIMDELVDLGLLQNLSYEPTQKGSMVAGMATKHGPRDARIMAQRKAAAGIRPVQGDGRYSEVGDRGDGMDDETLAPVSGDDLRAGAVLNKQRISRDNAI